MLKEEKELRKWAPDSPINDEFHAEVWKRKHLRLITALVRAVREDCANMAEWDRCGIMPEDNPRDRIVRQGIAAAIRSIK